MLVIKQILGMPNPKAGIPTEGRMVEDGSFLLPGCRTGVELEFEGCEVSDMDVVSMMKRGWKGKPDHSLREGGWEWVLTYPLSDSYLRGAVTYAMDMAARRKYLVSVRTGLHAHTDALDMNLNQYKMQMLLYSLIEPAIYRYAGCDRDENVHCLPWYSASDGSLAASEVYNSTEETFPGALRGDFRYGGLNLLATRKFGSVEWRHMKATLEPQKVMEWISITHRIKEAAIRLAGQPILDMVMSNPRAVLQEVLREQAEVLWYNGIEQECAKIGVQTMIDVVHRAGPKYVNYDWEDGGLFTRGTCEALSKFMAKRVPKTRPTKEPIKEEGADIDRMLEAFRRRDVDRPRARGEVGRWIVNEPVVNEHIVNQADIDRARQLVEQMRGNARAGVRRVIIPAIDMNEIRANVWERAQIGLMPVEAPAVPPAVEFNVEEFLEEDVIQDDEYGDPE
jgi:hypothetical protein